MASRRFLLLCAVILPFISFAEPPTEPSASDKKALEDLEQRTYDLKDGVYKSKARLRELEESVLRGKITGSKALIDFRNQAEGFFVFSNAEFFLDDQLISRIQGEGTKNPIEQVKVFDGDLPAGEHTLHAKIRYRGSDKSMYATFSYFKDHKFELETTEKFNVEYGKTTVVKLVAMDKGYFKTNIQERLFLQPQIIQDWGAEPPQ
jgi:hypothetical protein